MGGITVLDIKDVEASRFEQHREHGAPGACAPPRHLLDSAILSGYKGLLALERWGAVAVANDVVDCDPGSLFFVQKACQLPLVGR